VESLDHIGTEFGNFTLFLFRLEKNNKLTLHLTHFTLLPDVSRSRGSDQLRVHCAHVRIDDYSRQGHPRSSVSFSDRQPTHGNNIHEQDVISRKQSKYTRGYDKDL